jgi:hypothetical protein
LFLESGWTQTEIASWVGKSQFWVSCRLKFARFLIISDGYKTDTADLTERRWAAGNDTFK